MITKRVLISSLLLASSATVHAEVLAATPDHYDLKQEAVSALSPDELWDRLIQPDIWWHPDHTYSGEAEHVSLDLKAGGLWKETWDGGSVAHGTVLTVLNGKMLRLDAPFGPLQDKGVNVVWTITLAADGEGTKVTFSETANGTAASALDKLAPAVDYVKTEAITRLVSPD